MKFGEKQVEPQSQTLPLSSPRRATTTFIYALAYFKKNMMKDVSSSNKTSSLVCSFLLFNMVSDVVVVVVFNVFFYL